MDSIIQYFDLGESTLRYRYNLTIEPPDTSCIIERIFLDGYDKDVLTLNIED